MDSLAGLVDVDTGIVARVVCGGADGTPEGLPVCAAAVLRRSGISEVGFGKGLTRDDAMLGAVGEALEIYAGTQFDVAELCYRALCDLEGDAVDPRELCLYERAGFPYSEFDPRKCVHWTPGVWLDSREHVWMPALPVFLNFPVPREERFCQVTSNGLATGNGFEDAAIRAVLELIERDAFMLTWLARLPAVKVRIDAGLEPGLRGVLEPIEAKGARISIYLLDAGVDVPVSVCMARGDGRRWPGATLGLGAHPNPRVAVRKAIMEMGQTGHNLCAALTSGADAIPAGPREVRTFRQHALYYMPVERAWEFDFLSAGGSSVYLSDLSNPAGYSLSGVLEQLSDAGSRIAVADLTTSDLQATPFRVVRALGTNLQQIHCGFGMERTANPRLKKLLRGPINPAIAPVC